jgi:hypothetical protein
MTIALSCAVLVTQILGNPLAAGVLTIVLAVNLVSFSLLYLFYDKRV